MARHNDMWKAVLWALTVVASFSPRAEALYSVPDAAQSIAAGAQTQQTAVPAASPQPFATPATDPGKQIDELMKQCDREMNVTVQFQKVVECAQQALGLSEKAGDKPRAVMAMVYLAAAYSYQGEMNEASEVAQRSVSVAREAGDKKALEQALNTAAGVAGGAGRYEEALALFYQCLDIARASGDRVMEYMSLLNIGEAYTRSGEPERAEPPLQESLRLAATLTQTDSHGGSRAKKGTEMSLLNLGAMELELSRYREALGYYHRVQESRPESSLWAITALEGMAEAYSHLGDPQKASELLKEAIPQAEKAASGVQSARLWSELGENREALGQRDAALASQYRSLSMIHANGGDPDFEWQVEGRIGHALRALGKQEDALGHYQKAINGIEGLRSVAINTEEGRAGVLARSRAVYVETADLLADLHRDADAFEMAERGRARGFVEMLAATRGGLPDELTPEQAKNESALQSRVVSIQKALWKEGIAPAEERERRAELTAAEDDLDAFHVAVRRSNPRYASLHYPETMSASRVQSDLLDHQSVLLEFMLGEKRSLVWVISKDCLKVAVLPPRKDIEERVVEFHKVLTDKSSVLTVQSSAERIDRLGSALYSTLFAPIRNAVPPGAHVIVVPDGMLGYLPFEALVTGTRRNVSGEVRPVYALERYRITYAPSASALTAIEVLNPSRNDWQKSLLAFGDPVVEGRVLLGSTATKPVFVRGSGSDSVTSPEAPHTQTVYQAYAERGFSLARLPFTREEVLGIGRLFPIAQRQLYLGNSATEEAMKKEKLDSYRYIHLASHGFIDESAPGRSGILFSTDSTSKEDGVLRTDEIMRLKLSADLVTLSACSTGLGKFVNGEGFLGLTRAFFYAGARNVAVSLWNVNDAATAALMRAFYAHLKRGETKTDALRAAKLSLLAGSDPAWRHPYFWGAFVLVGDGD